MSKFRKPGRIAVALMLALAGSVSVASDAFASCGNRPGTPTSLRAFSNGPGMVDLTWISKVSGISFIDL